MALTTSRAQHPDQPSDDDVDVARRLLDSSAQLSYDPLTEVDWDTPLDKDFHGASPEWSTLYGTAYWDEMSDAQRKELTRQEAASVAYTGIWFEMILQQMILRDIYSKDPTDETFQWALTEIADECRRLDHVRPGREEARRPRLPPAPGRGGTG